MVRPTRPASVDRTGPYTALHEFSLLLAQGGHSKKSLGSRHEKRRAVVRTFEDNEHGYRLWVCRHPRGYVLNYRMAVHEPDNLILHSAECKTIIPRPGRNWTRHYGEACSIDRRELEAAAAERWRGEAQPHQCLSN